VEKGVFRGQEEADARCCPLENNNNNINKKGGSVACGRGVALTLDNFFSPHIIFFPFFQQTFAIFVVAGKAVQ